MKTLPDNFEIPYSLYTTSPKMGIPVEFMEAQLPEFIFYWREGKGKGTRRKSWAQTYWNWVKNAWSYEKAKEKKTKTVSTVPFREPEKVSNQLSPSENHSRLQALKRLL